MLLFINNSNHLFSLSLSPVLPPFPPSLSSVSPRRWCFLQERRSGGSSRTPPPPPYPKLCHQVQCQLLDCLRKKNKKQTLANKTKQATLKKKKKDREKKNNEKRNNRTTATSKKKEKKINRVMDAPTYSLNQKWSVKKSIYGNFHSLFYVSILVPFVLFPAGFFLSLKHGTVHCQKQKWRTECGQSTNFCVWC